MKIRRKNINLHMPGDTEKTPAEISSSISSMPQFAQAHGLDSNIGDQENEGKLEGSVNIEDFVNSSGETTCEQEGDMGSVEENGNDLDKIAQIGGLAKCGSENDEVSSGGIEVDDEEMEDEGDKKHDFYVGKYVWGKVVGNPWWPGQIYDPSDASDYAKKRQKGEKLLVAYFGDGSFSWCSLSQLKPFAENFKTMSKQNTSRKLMHAVEEALNGIGRIVEFKMSCSCIAEENRSALVTPLAINGGLRQGALVPDSDLNEIPQLEPVDVFTSLKSIANGSFTCKLKLRILKCWLSAFHRTNGRNELAVFNETQVLEESEEKGSMGLVDLREAVLDLDEGPLDEDWTPVSPELEFGESNQHWLRKCVGVEADSLYQKRKTRSVSKLMKEVNFDEPNSEKGNTQRDSKCGKRPANEEEDPSQSVSTDGKKRQIGLKSLKQRNYKASSTFGVGEGQLVSEKKNEFLIEKADKSTTGETENVAATRDKRETRSAHKDSKGKTVDHAHGNLASPLSKTTRKRKKNGTLDEIIERNENAKNSRTKKVSSTENDEREEPENVAAKVKKYGTEKVDKVPEEGEIENVVASREKRITRSSVKESEGRSVDEDPSHMGKDVSSPLKNASRKRKKNETLNEINEKKDCATNGSTYKIINIENYEIEKTVNKSAKDKESGTEKVGKITIGESKHVAASRKKWRTRSTLKGSKGKSADEALNHRGKDLSPPLQETAWKRKNNKMLDGIMEGKEYVRNGSSNKVTSSVNDEQEKTENLPAKDKVSDTEKVDKVGQRQTGKVAASEEKRTTRSSVKGLKEKNVDEEALSQRGENMFSPLQKTTMKRKRTENYEMSEIMENKKGAKIVIGTKNDAIKETGNARASRERKKSMYLPLPFINFASSTGSLDVKNVLMGERMTRVASEIIGPTPTLNNSKEYLQDNVSKDTSVDASPNHQSKEKEKQIIDERLNIVADQNLRSTSTLNCNDEKLQDNVSNKLATFLNLFKDPSPQRSEKEKEIINERDTTVANEILRSTPTLNSSNQKLVDNLSDIVVTFDNPFPDPSSQPSKEEEDRIISSVQINASLKEVVSKLRSAALNPLIVWDQNFLNMVVGFISAYRNVNYLYGSYHNTFLRNSQQGEEQKSVETGSELMKASEKDPGEDAPKPASLLVIFPPGFCLPSKTDLIAIFSKFGPVKELETDVSHESYSAMVVFLSYSDMKKAFMLCLENNPFGYAKVSYRLRYSAGSSKAKESLIKPDLVWSSSEFAGTCLLFIKQKLEIMTSMVDDCGGNMSSESMMKLQNEMKGLLDNISIVTKSTLA